MVCSSSAESHTLLSIINVDASWRSTDTSHQKTQCSHCSCWFTTTVSGYFTGIFNRWLIFNFRNIFSFYLTNYFEIWKFILTGLVPFCLVVLECFCNSMAFIKLVKVEWCEKLIQCVTSLYASVKGLITSSKIYVCSFWYLLGIVNYHVSSLGVCQFFSVYLFIRFFSSSNFSIYNFYPFRYSVVKNYIVYT